MPILDQLKHITPTISVGILTADMMNLGSQLKLIEGAGVRLLHFDVMDGCFCPMMTVGPPFIKAVKTALLKDVHLMIEGPLDKLEGFVSAGADVITVNVESCRHLHQALRAVGQLENANERERGILRGVSLNPSTPIEVVTPILDEVEMVVLLAVNPGYGGQRFIPSTKERLLKLRELIRQSGKEMFVCIDGGVTKDNIGHVARMGADIIVTGSAVFDGKDPSGNASFMLQTVERERANWSETGHH
jgi:ribulose-phosphate 3-epimerase